MSTSSHWSHADQAELDVILYELADAYAAHRPACAQCQAYDARQPGSSPCQHLQAAIGIVLDWRERRHLLTRAEDLRRDRAHLEHHEADAA